MESKLSRWCEGILETGWIIAVVATPLFFNIHSARVFEPDKLTLLRSIALLMSVAWIARFIDQRGWESLSWLRWRDERSVWRTPFVLPVAAIVVIYILSSIFSVTPVVSWAGSYQRLQGTYSTMAYIVIFASMASTIRSRAQVRRLVTAVIATSIPVALYAMLQRTERDPLPWGGNTVTRVAGHLGNAIFIAAYLIMAVPLTGARILDAFTDILEDEKLSVADIVRSAIYIFALAIQAIAIFWSGSRGPWLGIGAGAFAFILIVLVSLRNAVPDQRGYGLRDGASAFGLVFGGAALVFVVLNSILGAMSSRVESLAGGMSSFLAFAGAVGTVVLAILILIVVRRGWRWLWSAWILTTMLVSGWLGLFNLAGGPSASASENTIAGNLMATVEEWRDLPSIGRLGRLLQSEGGTGRVRVLIWEGALDLIAPHPPLTFPDGNEDSFNFLRPVLGYGPESMYVAYNKFYPPELATVEARNASPDRSHNETFDALVITGAAGFVAWQVLYLSVFYFAFSWLGVVRTRRDRILLIGLWIGGAALSGVLLSVWLGVPFFGVAVPFGSIFGLVVYLGYYALFARGGADDVARDPFAADRLLLTGLVAAVIAHYVEVHFGIAIAATRTHFFAYLALILLVGYVLPRVGEAENAPAAQEASGSRSNKRRLRRKQVAAGRGTPVWVGPVAGATLVMALIVGILGYNYTTYSLPPGETIQSLEQVPTAGEVFHQSFFVNASKGYETSPFIFLMVMMTWSLGAVSFLAEMVKEGVFSGSDGPLPSRPGQEKIAVAILAAWALGGVLIRFFPGETPLDTTARLGRSLLLIWSAVTAGAAVSLLAWPERGRLVLRIVAVMSLLASLPLFFAGAGLIGLLFLISGVAIYVLLPPDGWRESLLSGLVVGGGSILLGLGYTFFLAGQVRQSILAPAGVTADTPEVVRRVLESEQAAGYLTGFYVFAFLVLFIGALLVVLPRIRSARSWGSAPAIGAMVVLVVLGFVAVSVTNLRVIHADIVYKRADPWEKEATRTANLATWDVAIAIYERAIELAPREDYYYLFLGRAYLEKATLLGGDPVAQEALLTTASASLQRAQDLNPLNTDHTANLARLNTRWADALEGSEREKRVENARLFYDRAVELSPQNAVIRNERARLAYAFGRDCAQAIALYNESAEVDPYYATTRFERAEINIACAGDADAEQQEAYYRAAIESLEEGLASDDRDPRRWTQLAQVHELLSEFDESLAAYEQAIEREDGSFPAWRTSYAMATIAEKAGDIGLAIRYAEASLAGVPPEQAPQVEAYLANLMGEPTQEGGVRPELETVPPESFRLLEGERPLAGLPLEARLNYYDTYPQAVIDTDKVYDAIIVTEKGDMRVRLYDDEAPLTVNNFVFLATQGFYDGVPFHRVLAGQFAQGGDPSGVGTGGPGYRFVDETDNGIIFDRSGLIAMANAGPDTNGSQFFITQIPAPLLDGRHTVFGELLEGEDVLRNITVRNPASENPPPADLISRIDILVAEP